MRHEAVLSMANEKDLRLKLRREGSMRERRKHRKLDNGAHADLLKEKQGHVVPAVPSRPAPTQRQPAGQGRDPSEVTSRFAASQCSALPTH